MDAGPAGGSASTPTPSAASRDARDAREGGSGGSPAPSTDVSVVDASQGEEQAARMARLADACRTILECLGEDPEREGLRKTPMRVAKSLLSLTSGYAGTPAAVVGDALFSVDARELVLVRDIDVFSLCEHHLLPFFGRAHVGYLPAGRVVGLSKLARLVDLFAKRLQVQERLTQQIADAVQEATGARGVAVVIEATHLCMSMRGVSKSGATTQSTAYTGAYRDGPDARELKAEMLAAVKGGGGGGGGGSR